MMTFKLLRPALRFAAFNDDWQKKKVSELGVVITGNTPPTANREFYDGKYLFVSPGDIKGNRYVVDTNIKVTDLGIKKSRLVKKGSTLFVCIGSTIGKVAQAGDNCITNQQINSIVPFKEYTCDFIFSSLQFHSKKISMLAAEQAVPIINKTTFSNYLLSVPSFFEQEKIANFLTAIDDKIQQFSRKTALLEQYKKGVMQQIFSQKIRFKDDDDKSYPEWMDKKIQDLVNIKYGKDQKKVISKEGVNPILGTGGEIGRTNQFLYDKPSVLLGRKGTIDKPKYIDKPFWTVDTLFYTEINNCVHPKWLYYQFCTINWYLYNEASGVPSLSASTISKVQLSLPCVQEQIKIAALLSSIDEKINHVNRQLEQIKHYKKGLLQQMFV